MTEEAIANEFRDGTYRCAGCSTVLYVSGDKFRTKGKWAAFRKAATPEVVKFSEDDLGLEEIVCAKCDKSIGNLYHDGKKAGDEHPEAKDRHLVLSKAVVFEAADPNEPAPQMPETTQPTLTLNVNSTQERPTTPPLGLATASSKPLKQSRPKSKRPAPGSTTPTSSSKEASNTSNQTAAPSNVVMGAVAVAAVVIVGIGGWLGYRRFSNRNNK